MTMLAFAVLFVPGVEAASCRGYPQGVRAVLKKQVEALRALERETADRLKGLDTRPFDYLLSRARATAQVIADKDALAAEERSSASSRHSRPARSSRTRSRFTHGLCRNASKWMDFAPLLTVFRTID